MPRSGKLNRFIGCPLELEDRRAGRLPSLLSMERTSYEAFGAGGTAQPPLPLQSFLPPWPWPLQAFLPAQSCLYSFDAQPPLPLHEFLPAQPASPDLQLPCDLHELRPLQACLSSAFFVSVAICTACDWA